jgi:hypothetical protein
VGGLPLSNDLTQNIARLFFHRTTMFRRADAQATLDFIVQFSDRDTCHNALRV